MNYASALGVPFSALDRLRNAIDISGFALADDYERRASRHRTRLPEAPLLRDPLRYSPGVSNATFPFSFLNPEVKRLLLAQGCNPDGVHRRGADEDTLVPLLRDHAQTVLNRSWTYSPTSTWRPDGDGGSSRVRPKITRVIAAEEHRRRQTTAFLFLQCSLVV